MGGSIDVEKARNASALSHSGILARGASPDAFFLRTLWNNSEKTTPCVSRAAVIPAVKTS